MSFLWVTIPVSLLVAVALLALVLHAVRSGGFDDWEGPSVRLHHDEDAVPELSASPRQAEAEPSAQQPESRA